MYYSCICSPHNPQNFGKSKSSRHFFVLKNQVKKAFHKNNLWFKGLQADPEIRMSRTPLWLFIFKEWCKCKCFKSASWSVIRMFWGLSDPHPDPLVTGTDPRIRIRIWSVPKCYGSPTLPESTLGILMWAHLWSERTVSGGGSGGRRWSSWPGPAGRTAGWARSPGSQGFCTTQNTHINIS